MNNEDFKTRIANSDIVIRATHDEFFFLWERYSRQSMRKDVCNRHVFEQLNPGQWFQIGRLEDMPVCLSVSWNKIDGVQVMNIEATSQVVDERMVRKWMAENLKPAAFVEDPALDGVSEAVLNRWVHETGKPVHWFPKLPEYEPAPSAKKIKSLCDETVFVLTATHREMENIYEKFDKSREYRVPHFNEYNFMPSTAKYRLKLGEFAGEPVEFNLRWWKIDGFPILVTYPVSDVVDYRMLDDWIEKNCKCRWDGGTRRAVTNSSNIHHLLDYVRDPKSR